MLTPVVALFTLPRSEVSVGRESRVLRGDSHDQVVRIALH